MTLSRFLRDYLYIPLGGNRHGPLRRQINLLTTMVLGGLWHGAGWNFAIWGALHGVFLVVNNAWRDISEKLPVRVPQRLGHGLGVCFTFVCVVFAWVYFRSPDLVTANRIVLGMLGAHGVSIPEAIVSRLGPLWTGLKGIGVRDFLGGGSTFIETWIWILIGMGTAFLFPNTQEIMRRFDPALPDERTHNAPEPSRFAWQPRRRDAVLIGFVFALGILALSHPTEFLYFQF